MSGWKLVSSLLAKHVGTVGDRLAQQIAAFDPETATQVDRDNLQAKLHEVAVKLAEAKQKNGAAQKAAAELKASIDGDVKASVVLIAKFEKQEINEVTLTQFTNDLERRQQELPRGFPQVRWLDALPESFEGAVFGNEVLDAMPVDVVTLTEEGWRKLTIRWALFFAVMAVVNELVWRNVSTDAWVSFKAFGFLPLTFLFAIAQVPLMQRHGQEPPEQGKDAP